jgi:hypothetical protein
MSNDFSSIDFSDVPNHEIQGIDIVRITRSDMAMKGSMKFAQLSQRMYVSYEMLKDDMHHIAPSIRWKALKINDFFLLKWFKTCPNSRWKNMGCFIA